MNKKNASMIVLTGGPCAGKTTMAELLARAFQHSVVNVPEAASLLFSGGFPRFPVLEARRAVQRAIFSTQHALEEAYRAQFPEKILILDRGTIDGAAYWPEGSGAYFEAMGTTLEAELSRYARVIYLESAAEKDYQVHRTKNPNRTEDWTEAKRLDEQTRGLWVKHPDFIYIQNKRSFDRKVSEVLAAVAVALPQDDENET